VTANGQVCDEQVKLTPVGLPSAASFVDDHTSEGIEVEAPRAAQSLPFGVPLRVDDGEQGP
jgi:hypothetical protein